MALFYFPAARIFDRIKPCMGLLLKQPALIVG
jgi:hypothetical protein